MLIVSEAAAELHIQVDLSMNVAVTQETGHTQVGLEIRQAAVAQEQVLAAAAVVAAVGVAWVQF